jgi:hypothetical protein
VKTGRGKSFWTVVALVLVVSLILPWAVGLAVSLISSRPVFADPLSGGVLTAFSGISDAISRLF